MRILALLAPPSDHMHLGFVVIDTGLSNARSSSRGSKINNDGLILAFGGWAGGDN